MQYFLSRLCKELYSHLSRLTWEMVALLVTLHFATSYVLFRLSEVGEIVEWPDFLYFYTTTAFTIGYGDLAPRSNAGRVVTSLWLQPGGIILFTMVVARFAQWISTAWRRRMRGEASYEDLRDHVVIMGWQGNRTRRMVEELCGDSLRRQREIVLCTTKEIENPMPDRIRFVREAALSAPSLAERAALSHAAVIIVLGHDDSDTLAAALAASASNKSGHIVAHFEDESFAALLRAHCPRAEAVLSVEVEMLVRAAEDPGTSRVVKDLLSTAEREFHVSLRVPKDAPPMPYLQLLLGLKARHGATLIGVADAGGTLALNADPGRTVSAGETLYMIASQRVLAGEVDWSTIGRT
jgi:voltage-gated potassium channel